MKKQHGKARWIVGMALIAGASGAAEMPPSRPPFVALERSLEIEQALSAAPAHLRARAGVFVLGATGFERARESENGFNCLVHRVRRIAAPTCFDREGSESNLQKVLRETQLQLSGKAPAEVDAAIAADYASGALRAPARPGVAYMLSPHFELHGADGSKNVVFAPHLMFYAPYAKNSDIGALPEHFNDPHHAFVLDEGKPSAYFIVVPHGVDLPEEPVARPGTR